VLVRPHYVIGGEGMRVVRTPEQMVIAGPALIDEFLEDWIELDVDLLCDGREAWVAGILEQIEPTGTHSGDSACVVPAPSISERHERRIRRLASAVAGGLRARGVMNLQLAVRGDEIKVLEANPRASRTLPFLAKATGRPLVAHACRLMLGRSLKDLSLPERAVPTRSWAKEPIFPTDRFPGADARGPEMRSTGEVMAGGATVIDAHARARRAAGHTRTPGRIGPSLQELGKFDATPTRLTEVRLT
jgi:carbamoyl-phosphate synthase large subunit